MILLMSRKFTITIVLILFLLPFGSWYYLNSGLTWRKKAESALSGKASFLTLPLVTREGQKLTQDNLQNHVSIVTMLSCIEPNTQEKLITGFYDQFKETKKANFIFLDTCATGSAHWMDSLRQNMFVISCIDTVRQCEPILARWPAGKEYAIIDQNGVVRNYYTAGTQEEKRVLLEHMALLLPRDHSEKVELKRAKENKQ
jgi:hypothetical protein